jgi:hypothetical protein
LRRNHAAHLRQSHKMPRKLRFKALPKSKALKLVRRFGVNMAPGLRELIAVSLLAGLGCGLALAHGDLFFVAVFGGAIAMAIIEAIRRL